ncbi:hypothetical protein AVEN_33227-1 [Araneus ventricosus]|uniref:Uncharacterized protein n=1 Tax=Araneus ventricosus TaxID=182803 RepID=A0A4Y2R8Q3_ARAVE|nr:hypothetical protein AVEN_33227-1 [Araneus ventricosus]
MLCFSINTQKPRWPSGKVSDSESEGGTTGSKPDSTEDPRVLGLFHVKSYIEGQTSSRWCGAEVWRGATTSGVVLVDTAVRSDVNITKLNSINAHPLQITLLEIQISLQGT